MTNPPRLGPRPLPLHLAAQAATLISSHAALPALRNGSLAWNPRLRPAADALRNSLAAIDAERFERALVAEAGRRVDGFLRGIAAYRHHPYRRDMPDVPAVWREGTTRLLDYSRRGASGMPVLVIPSLINRAYILDLSKRRSVMRSLAERGFRPYLVDWGAPGPQELAFGLDDYIGGRLVRILEHVERRAGKPALLGYCMGGLLALALGALRPDSITGLALFATPWDFHRPDDTHARLLLALRQPIEDAIATFGGVPTDMLQACFAAVDPAGIERKFRTFADLPAASARLNDFVALEDWLNDGITLAGPVARETLFGWYVENRPARGTWQVAGRTVKPDQFARPALVIVPARDRIVPPASALALGDALPQARTVTLETGHIGMVTGAEARSQVYRRLTLWLHSLEKKGGESRLRNT